MAKLKVTANIFIWAEYIGDQCSITGLPISLYNVFSNAIIDCPSKRKLLDREHVGSTVSIEKLKGLVESIFIGQCRVTI